MSARETTVVPPSVDVVLVMGGSAELARAVSLAATSVDSSIGVHRCDFLSAVAEAAEIRPMAIAMSAAAYAFDPTRLSMLARDVGARLLLVESEELGLEETASAIRPQLEAIFAERHQGSYRPLR